MRPGISYMDMRWLDTFIREKEKFEAIDPQHNRHDV